MADEVRGAVYFTSARSPPRIADTPLGTPAALIGGGSLTQAEIHTDADGMFAPLLAQQNVVGAIYFSAPRIHLVLRADLLGSAPALLAAPTLSGPDVVPRAAYFSVQLPGQQRPEQIIRRPPPYLIAEVAQTLFQVAIHADIDVFFGSSLSGGIQLPGRIGTTTRFMVNLGTMTSRQH